MRLSLLQSLVVLAFLLATTGYAQALIIPDATYQLAVSGLTNSQSYPSGIGTLAPGQVCDTGAGGACETSTATVDGINASISGSEQCRVGFPQPCASNSIQATASVNTTFYYAVINTANPLDTTMVPLLITASITTGVSGPGTSAGTSVGGSITWGDTPTATFYSIQACTLLGASFCSNPGPNFGSDANTATSPNADYLVTADRVQSIVETLSGGTASSTGGTGFTGSLDPLVVIDPTFLLNNPEYILVFSANIPTAPTSVPEPSSMALLGAGLFGLGFIHRRRKTG